MVKIRPAEPKDSAEILDIYGPIIDHSATSFETVIPSLQEFQTRISKIQQSFPWLVCQWDQQIAGYAYAGPHRSREAYQWSTELSVYISHNFQRRGLARALYTALMDILRLQGFYRALAGISLPNKVSVGFHEALGFTPVGVYKDVGFKLGQWHSVGWWEYALKPFDLNPKKTLDPDQLRDTEAWHQVFKSTESMINKRL